MRELSGGRSRPPSSTASNRRLTSPMSSRKSLATGPLLAGTNSCRGNGSQPSRTSLKPHSGTQATLTRHVAAPVLKLCQERRNGVGQIMHKQIKPQKPEDFQGLIMVGVARIELATPAMSMRRTGEIFALIIIILPNWLESARPIFAQFSHYDRFHNLESHSGHGRSRVTGRDHRVMLAMLGCQIRQR